jgi:hypothetical protein
MTAREIADTRVADKAPQATRKQAIDLQAAVLAALRKRNGAMVVSAGSPARWELKEAADLGRAVLGSAQSRSQNVVRRSS